MTDAPTPVPPAAPGARGSDAPIPAPPDAPRRATPGVPLPPPLLPALVIALAEALGRWGPPLRLAIGTPSGRRVTAAVLAGAALLLAGAAVLALRRARTPVEPWKATRAIVRSGVYARTRNPVYVAFLLVQGAWGVARASGWTLVLLPFTLLLLDRLIVRREERYLAARFGAPYEAYRARVRRWL